MCPWNWTHLLYRVTTDLRNETNSEIAITCPAMHISHFHHTYHIYTIAITTYWIFWRSLIAVHILSPQYRIAQCTRIGTEAIAQCSESLLIYAFRNHNNPRLRIDVKPNFIAGYKKWIHVKHRPDCCEHFFMDAAVYIPLEAAQCSSSKVLTFASFELGTQHKLPKWLRFFSKNHMASCNNLNDEPLRQIGALEI